MTAAGLAVAIPAVLAYNIFGRNISRIEADLEGFAFDLRELLAPTFVASRSSPTPGGVDFHRDAPGEKSPPLNPESGS